MYLMMIYIGEQYIVSYRSLIDILHMHYGATAESVHEIDVLILYIDILSNTDAYTTIDDNIDFIFNSYNISDKIMHIPLSKDDYKSTNLIILGRRNKRQVFS